MEETKCIESTNNIKYYYDSQNKRISKNKLNIDNILCIPSLKKTLTTQNDMILKLESYFNTYLNKHKTAEDPFIASSFTDLKKENDILKAKIKNEELLISDLKFKIQKTNNESIGS